MTRVQMVIVVLMICAWGALIVAMMAAWGREICRKLDALAKAPAFGRQRNGTR